MAAAHQLHGLLRLPPPPRPLRLRPLLVPPIPCRGRPPLATLRIPESPPQPPPKKRLSSASEAKSETAEALREENGATEAGARQVQEEEEGYVESVGAEDPAGPPDHHLAARAGLGEPVFFLLTFVAVTTSVAFTSMVAVAIPTMLAMRRAANSFALLADAALDELPSTMLAVRLTAMELSDLTLELSDLSQEIATGVNKSANIVQAVQDGIGQMRTLARQQVHRMMEERENLRNNTSAGPAKSSPDSSSQ